MPLVGCLVRSCRMTLRVALVGVLQGMACGLRCDLMLKRRCACEVGRWAARFLMWRFPVPGAVRHIYAVIASRWRPRRHRWSTSRRHVGDRRAICGGVAVPGGRGASLTHGCRLSLLGGARRRLLAGML